jgi:hypothetical protein
VAITIMSREDAGLDPVVYTSGGNPRPPLDPNLEIMTGHYTGVEVVYGTRDTASVLRQINDGAKPNEYNYVVDQAGVIWEFAGDYRAAHSLYNNDIAIGVLMLLGIGEAPSDALVLAFRQLRYMLIQRGRLTPTCRTLKHSEMVLVNPNTTRTACPGVAVAPRWTELVAPWAPPPPPPLPPEVSDVQELITCAGSTFASNFPFVTVIPDGSTLKAITDAYPGIATRAVAKAAFHAFVLVGRRPGGTWADADFNHVLRTYAPPPPPA